MAPLQKPTNSEPAGAPIAVIESTILLIRGHKVMLDADLARMYGVSTKRLNEQVRRNRERFPHNFMFQLTESEKAEVVANCDHLRGLKFSHVPPAAFTEHGALMAASVLNTERAIKVSVYVVRAFVKLRRMAAADVNEVSRRIDELEKKFVEHDKKFGTVFAAIRELMAPPLNPKRRPIGFSIKQEE